MSKKYTIKDLEKITNIKAHTIRIWEKRYNILTPQRTATNIRYYNEQDVKKLLMVVILYRNGMKISEISKLPLHRLQELVLSFKLPHESQTQVIEQLMLAVTDFNEEFFEEIIINDVIDKGIENAVEQTFFPFLKKMILLWLTDAATSLQLNFAQNQITKFLWRNLKFQHNRSDKCFVIFSPSQHYTAPSIIYMYYLLNKQGFQVTYIGNIEHSEQILETQKFKNCTLVTSYSIVNKDFYEALNNAEQNVIVLDLCSDLQNYDNPKVKIVRDIKEFKELIKNS